MARKFAGEIAEALIAAGRKADEPAADHRQCGARRSECDRHHPGRPGRCGRSKPALSIMVVGENVRLRDELDWLGKTAGALNPA